MTGDLFDQLFDVQLPAHSPAVAVACALLGLLALPVVAGQEALNLLRREPT